MAIDYFTEAELRALPQMGDAITYTTARVEAAAAYITAVLEDFVGTSFVARTVTAEVHDGGACEIVLNKPYALSVTSATENGVPVTDSLSVLAGVVHKTAAGSYSPIPWVCGSRNVTVTYQAGFSATPPAHVKEAALRATREYLLETNSNAAVVNRIQSVTNENGTFPMVPTGPDRPTGYPSVDAILARLRDKFNVFGFA